MSIEDLGGKIYGGLEVVFHHPLETFKDYHMQVSPDLWRGSWPNQADLMWLVMNKVNIVVNLCKERNQDSQVSAAGMKPINIPILDGSPPTMDQAVEFFRILNEGGNIVYVHCEAGHGRTGCMCAYYRVIVDKWSKESALQEALFIAGGHLEPDQQKWILSIV